MSTTPIHSTGRGGAGNIGRDDTVYADGAITREGPQGEAATLNEFSTGRGGAGNMGKSPRLGPQVDSPRRSTDIVPELATRESQDEFHTGRGGAGNVYKEKHGGHSKSPDHHGLGDKIKQALHLDKDKKHESSPLGQETTVVHGDTIAGGAGDTR
ncbi:uncharacterized protein M421DRAFT_417081 [Didymella exigua CBS 183.55]|uniref:Uncharacterized protein n=1 Tax=Didymella exigua CBS 183.55 TaxID=1150837 RepID=A0A6A5RV79_9PLEO|nr:uncharacterized protein M421DRAFT_417081 [Didymella exigua CBS 183.55]KAF1932361.1 hypothetical protein M421DRAFT_417081 [Didymella exigua CBS 183.55]